MVDYLLAKPPVPLNTLSLEPVKAYRFCTDLAVWSCLYLALAELILPRFNYDNSFLEVKLLLSDFFNCEGHIP